MKKLLFIALPLLVVVIIIAGVLFTRKVGVGSNDDKSNNVSITPAASPQATTVSVNYKDGTYTAEGTYEVHIGPKKIGVKITLKNNVITAADVTKEGDDPTSLRYQNQFISGYKDVVIGKNIKDVNLSKVSGSSLTPIGFNDALTKIETQAKI
jgi:uncharacterized protein with FMN-binding domain